MKKKSKAGRPVTFWTAERIAVLKKHYPVTSNEQVADLLGTTVRAVRSKVMVLKIKKKDRYWDRSDEDYLKKNWDYMSAVELAEKLGKTKWAVINKYRELSGLR